MKNDRAESSATSSEHEHSGSKQDRKKQAAPQDETSDKARERRERALDKTVADSFPGSDPPSSIPDPGEEDPLAA